MSGTSTPAHHAGSVLVNSLPKSGTHLLERALMILGLQNWETSRSTFRRATDRAGLSPPSFLAKPAADRWRRLRRQPSHFSAEGAFAYPVGVFTPEYFDRATALKWLSPRRPASFVKGHIPYTPPLAKLIDAIPGLTPVTIIRDPRAVVASVIPYVLDARHWTHFLQAEFEGLDEDARVDFVLNGGTARTSGLRVLSLAEAYGSVLDWQHHAGTLVVRFEDLVGAQGGGRDEAQVDTFEALANHLGIALTDTLRGRMRDVFDPSAPTFRGGRIDGWRTRLTPDQIRKTEAAMGPALFERAGYGPDGH